MKNLPSYQQKLYGYREPTPNPGPLRPLQTLRHLDDAGAKEGWPFGGMVKWMERKRQAASIDPRMRMWGRTGEEVAREYGWQ